MDIATRAQPLRAAGPAVAGGAALGFSGYALGMSNNLPYLVGLATLPWVGAVALRVARRGVVRDAAALGACWALLFLCGDAQDFLLAPLLLLAALPAAGDKRRTLLLFALAGALAAALTGAELLPALAVSRESLRGAGDPSPTLAFSWSLSPLRLPELITSGYVPDAFRFRVVGELLGGGTALWSSSLFAGAAALFFATRAACSRDRLALALGALALVAVLLAFGSRTPLLPLVWKLLPPLSKFRYPEKYLALFFTALAPLAALGIDRARQEPVRHARLLLYAAVAVALAAAAVQWLDVVGGVFAAHQHPLAADDLLRATLRAAWAQGLFKSAGVLVLAAAVLRLSATRPRAALLLPAVIFLELWSGNGDQLPLVPRVVLEEPAPFASLISNSAGGARPAHRLLPEARPAVSSTVTLGDGPRWVATMRLLLRPDVAGLDHVAAFGSTLPALSARTSLVLGITSPEAAAHAALFDGCFRVADPAAPARAGDERLAAVGDPPLALIRQPCSPRARLSGMRSARDRDEALALVRRGLPRGTDVWEGGPELAPAEGSVRWLLAEPELLRLQVDARAPAALVVADEFAPGWTATIDGLPAPILAADVAARAVAVPAGAHVVEMRYATPRLAAGIGLSLLGVVACLACALISRRRTSA